MAVSTISPLVRYDENKEEARQLRTVLASMIQTLVDEMMNVGAMQPNPNTEERLQRAVEAARRSGLNVPDILYNWTKGLERTLQAGKDVV